MCWCPLLDSNGLLGVADGALSDGAMRALGRGRGAGGAPAPGRRRVHVASQHGQHPERVAERDGAGRGRRGRVCGQLQRQRGRRRRLPAAQRQVLRRAALWQGARPAPPSGSAALPGLRQAGRVRSALGSRRCQPRTRASPGATTRACTTRSRAASMTRVRRGPSGRPCVQVAAKCAAAGADRRTAAPGDYIKFNWPQAWSVSMLAWVALMYPQGLQATGSYDALLSNIRCARPQLARPCRGRFRAAACRQVRTSRRCRWTCSRAPAAAPSTCARGPLHPRPGTALGNCIAAAISSAQPAARPAPVSAPAARGM